jgi:tetratricopeptide (TPR) repeat protein
MTGSIHRIRDDGTTEQAASPAQPAVQDVFASAFRLHQEGQTRQAEALYRAILASPSVHAASSYCLGHLCITQGRLEEAVAAFRRTIAIQNDHADAMAGLGAALSSLGRPAEAVEAYRCAIIVKPDFALAYSNLGKALLDLGQFDEAIAACRQAIALQPNYAFAYANLGAALFEHKRWAEAVSACRRAIALQPDSVLSHANLGAALFRLGAFDEALAACREAVALRPGGALIWATLGGVFAELGAPEEAVAACQKAIALMPALPVAHYNLSNAYKAMLRLPEAAASGRQAIALQPDNAHYHFLLGHILLTQGDFDAGWAEYDWRWKLQHFSWLHDTYGAFAQPQWSGEDLTGKTILIYTEQGLGDIILFARYLPLLVQRAGHVVVAANPRVQQLLDGIAGIDVVPVPEPLPPFDVHCPLLTLPRIFGTRLDSIPADVPYLRADPARTESWRGRLGPTPAALRVGIVWAGNPATDRDRFRSPGLASLAPLFDVPGVQFVVLQVGPGRQDIASAPLPSHVIDVGEELADFSDTAAVMAGLDLVISSCTAPLHLAGALGRPSWGMIPFVPYYPWLTDRSDSPWYPTMRLYRQDKLGADWAGVVGRIAADLTAWASRQRDRRISGGYPGRIPTPITIVHTTERAPADRCT